MTASSWEPKEDSIYSLTLVYLMPYAYMNKVCKLQARICAPRICRGSFQNRLKWGAVSWVEMWNPTRLKLSWWTGSTKIQVVIIIQIIGLYQWTGLLQLLNSLLQNTEYNICTAHMGMLYLTLSHITFWRQHFGSTLHTCHIFKLCYNPLFGNEVSRFILKRS